ASVEHPQTPQEIDLENMPGDASAFRSGGQLSHHVFQAQEMAAGAHHSIEVGQLGLQEAHPLNAVFLLGLDQGRVPLGPELAHGLARGAELSGVGPGKGAKNRSPVLMAFAALAAGIKYRAGVGGAEFFNRAEIVIARSEVPGDELDLLHIKTV